MSIWMLLIFALSMLSGVLYCGDAASVNPLSLPAFIVTTMLFVGGLATRGIRRPVV